MTWIYSISFLVFLSVVQLCQSSPIRPWRWWGPGRGLAFAGGYAAGYHNGNYNYGSYPYYSSSYPCNCGKRKKRSVVDNFLQSNEVQSLYKEIRKADQNECGRRFICELAEKDIQQLNEKEVIVMLPYSGSGPSDGTAYGDYDEAVWIGHSHSGCSLKYTHCPLSSQELEAWFWKQAEESNEIIRSMDYLPH